MASNYSKMGIMTILMLGFMLLLALPCSAAQKVEVVNDGSQLTININGRQINCDQKPFIANNCTLVPVSIIAKEIGAETDWNPSEKTVKIKGSKTVVLTIGSATATIDGSPVTLQAPATVAGGRTMVPLRFVSEALGAEVSYIPPPYKSRIEWFQAANTQNIFKLQTKISQQLEDNHIGICLGTYYREDANQVNSPYYLDSYGDDPSLVYSNGFKWLRMNPDDWVGDVLAWQNVETKPGEYSFDPARGITNEEKYIGKTYPASHPGVDEVISEYANKGITMVLGLSVGNQENHQDVSRFRDQAEMERYANYVRFMVTQFKGRIKYYEIWNEPAGDLEDYVNLVKYVAPVIRQADPGAKIVIGSLGGEWIYDYPGYGKDKRYSMNPDTVKTLLTPDVAPLIDVVSFHPFYDNIPDDPYYQNYPAMIKELKKYADSNGFKGEFLAEELSWKSYCNENEQGKWFDEKVAVKYYARSMIMHRGLGITVSSLIRSSGLLEIMPNICTVMAGAIPVDLPITINSTANNISSYTFSLSNGDKLIALWTDGTAEINDLEVKADLTYDGFKGKEVTGIDIINGYTQSLEFSDNKIQGLIVRDYPLILKINNN